MTTKEYVQEIETEVKRLEIRELIESNLISKFEIRRKKTSMLRQLKALKKLWDCDINTAAFGCAYHETPEDNLLR